MEASKITLTEKTRAALQNPTLSVIQQGKLRRTLIKEYIRSKPAGTLIGTGELVKAARYSKKEYQKGWGIVRNLVDRGEITREMVPTTNKAIYTVVDDTKISRAGKVSPRPPTVADASPEMKSLLASLQHKPSTAMVNLSRLRRFFEIILEGGGSEFSLPVEMLRLMEAHPEWFNKELFRDNS